MSRVPARRPEDADEPRWPRPKYEQDDADKEPVALDNGSDAESPHLGSRYVPGSANGADAPTVPLRFQRAALSPSEVDAALGKD